MIEQSESSLLFESPAENLEQSIVSQLLDLGRASIKTMKVLAAQQEKLKQVYGT